MKACQTIIPSVPAGTKFSVKVKPEDQKPKAKFFSPQSFLDGVVNNGLGVVGFIAEGAKVDDAYKARIEKEAALAARVAARKQEQQSSK